MSASHALSVTSHATSASHIHTSRLSRSDDFEEAGKILLVHLELSLLSSKLLVDKHSSLLIGYLIEIDLFVLLVFPFGIGSIAACRLIVDIKHLESVSFVVLKLHLLGQTIGHAAIHLLRIHSLALSAIVVLSHSCHSDEQQGKC